MRKKQKTDDCWEPLIICTVETPVEDVPGNTVGINNYLVIAYANRGVELSLGNVLKFDG
jgi:hypothetical protein